MSKLLHVNELPSPDPDKEPSHLTYLHNIKQKLLNDQHVDVVTHSDTPPSEYTPYPGDTGSSNPHIKKTPIELLGEAIQQLDAKELVEIHGPFGRIQFRAMHISSNDYGLAFIVSKEHMTYEPSINTQLIIKYGGQAFNVVYAGGYFTFRRMPFTFISFIKITESSNDNERERVYD